MQGSILDHQYVSKVDEEPEPEEIQSQENDKVVVKESTIWNPNPTDEYKPKRSRKLDDSQRKTLKHKLRQLTGKPACKYCDKVFLTKEAKCEHKCVYLQCKPQNFICRFCHKELSRKTFSNHLHETLDCQYCQKSFMNPRNLKSHIQKLHSDEEYVPPKSLNPELFKDLGDQDEVDGVLQLNEETGLWFQSPVKVMKPRRRYQLPKGRFECDFCGRLFTTMRSLKNHLDIHMDNFKYVCAVCGEKYATSTGISKHACLNKKRKRPVVDFRTYDVRHCKYCGKIFPNFEENRAHQCENQFDNDPKSFKCRFCDTVMSKNSYNKHISRHLATEEDLTCKHCGKRLADATTLAVHITTHTGNKPFRCDFDECGQSFLNKSLLHRHLRFHGIDIEKFHCSLCMKEVASKYHLKSHMRTHEASAQCQLCKKLFKTRESLQSHYRKSHEPVECRYCKKQFVLPRYLKMHEKTHIAAEEKPFKCDYCSTKSFTKMALLMNHMLKNHEEFMDEWRKRVMN